MLAVREGFSPPPPGVGTSTPQLELTLGLEERAVYCYLGRTLQAFGEYAVAFQEIGSSTGAMVSPFDTGGLVSHCSPVSDWAPIERQKFLDTYSWPISEIDNLLALHPGTDQEQIAAYLDESRVPPEDGPHEVWPGGPIARIWTEDHDWRSWTWEGRVHPSLTAQDVVAWTCPQAHYPQIIEWFHSANDSAAQWFARISPHYVEGGTGILIDHLRQRQIEQ